MWLERFVIIVSSLAQDYLPSSWGIFQATRWDWATYLGTIGLFLFLFFLFIRLLPMISIFEVRTLLPQAKVKEEDAGMTKPIYGVMAEFDNPTALVNGRARGAREGLSQAGRLFAVPHRRTERRAAPAQNKLAADRADRRHRRRPRGLPAAVLRHGDLLPASTSAAGRCIAGRRTSSSPSS